MVKETKGSIPAIRNYKKEYDYSYTLGAFPTIEMIKAKPECVMSVYIHESFTEKEMLAKICGEKGIAVSENNKLIERLSDKSNVYVIGAFNKYHSHIRGDKPHIVLVNPSDMGNLGTIARTAVGFGIKNIAIISPGADIFHPKTIRSSMGSVFRLDFEYFDSFEEYRAAYREHEIFTFMLNGEKRLAADTMDTPELYSLVFGNEASGLDDSFKDIGTSLIIPQTDEVDSLNLTIAAGIGIYIFTASNRKVKE